MNLFLPLILLVIGVFALPADAFDGLRATCSAAVNLTLSAYNGWLSVIGQNGRPLTLIDDWIGE